jgi:RimJ/RimL family protein N-acetyltransferase
VLSLRMPLSEALGGNEASIRMLRRCGYVEVGRIPRRYFKRVAYRDALLFALDRT